MARLCLDGTAAAMDCQAEPECWELLSRRKARLVEEKLRYDEFDARPRLAGEGPSASAPPRSGRGGDRAGNPRAWLARRARDYQSRQRARDWC